MDSFKIQFRNINEGESMTKELLFAYKKMLESHRSGADAAAMKKYMKNHFEFAGIRSPQLKALNRTFFKKNGLPSANDYDAFIRLLWKEEERECQYTAQQLVLKFKKYWTLEDFDLAEHLITNRSWWDTVDFIASNYVGGLVIKYPKQGMKLMNKYLKSSTLWLNRTAILFQLKYRENTDWEFLQKASLAHATSKEFFHQKAIGWALREYSKRNQTAVYEFVNRHDFTNLTRREALKHISL